jgi:two-component system, OmpR family, response regulator
MRILVVEDEIKLASLIESVFREEGYSVDTAHDGDTGLEYVLRDIYDVAIVDWMLPGRDGPSLCRAIRSAEIQTSVLLLTARGQVEDRVAGLDSGADDYLVKPFAFDELLARVRALGRRFAVGGGDSWELRIGDLVLDQRAHIARRGNVRLDLTSTEWKLLEYLMRHPNQILSREQILNYVWSFQADIQPTQVDVYISYLRRKLNHAGRADPVATVRGAGYRLESDRV